MSDIYLAVLIRYRNAIEQAGHPLKDSDLKEVLSSQDWQEYCKTVENMKEFANDKFGSNTVIDKMGPEAERYWALAKTAIKAAKAATSRDGERLAEKRAEKALEAFEELCDHEKALFRDLTGEEELCLHHNKVAHSLPHPLIETKAVSRAVSIYLPAQRYILDQVIDRLQSAWEPSQEKKEVSVKSIAQLRKLVIRE